MPQHTATEQPSINADGHARPQYLHQAMEGTDEVDPVLLARFRGDTATQTENRTGGARKCCLHDVALAGVGGAIELELRAVIQPSQEQTATVQETTTQNFERCLRKARDTVTKEAECSTKAQAVAVLPQRKCHSSTSVLGMSMNRWKNMLIPVVEFVPSSRIRVGGQGPGWDSRNRGIQSEILTEKKPPRTPREQRRLLRRSRTAS